MRTLSDVAPGSYQVTPDPVAALRAMPGSEGRQINAKTPCGSFPTRVRPFRPGLPDSCGTR